MSDSAIETKKAWELITDAFLDKGVEFLFTVPGESISPVQRAVEDTPIKIIAARHEQSAAFMAETYGRMTRKPGIVVVTFGPGFTNTISAIQNANMSNSPLIVIAGAHPAKAPDRLGLQDMKQAPIIQTIVKKVLECRCAERIPDYIDMAFRYAMGGRPGPVFLELPIDVLDATVRVDQVVKPSTRVESRPYDPADVPKIMEIVGQSEKPMVIAGSGAYYSDAGKDITAFVEKTGIPVFTGKFARGLISDEHPMCFESSVGLRPGCAPLATIDSDCIIILGTRLCLYNANGDFYRRDAKLIQVDIEPEEIGRNQSIHLPVFGDVARVMDGCNQWIDQNNASDELKARFAPWLEALQTEHKEKKELAKFQTESNAVPINPGRLTAEIDAFMDREDDIVVADGGDLPGWVLITRTSRAPWNEMTSGLFGCLGCGLPYANAAKAIRPNSRVMLCIGDGSVGFNFMELETSIRKGLPIVVVIGNNNLWGMTANSMKSKFKHHVPGTVQLDYVPYQEMMKALGGVGILVEKPEDIRPALEEAFASGKTAVINVMIDAEIMGPASAGLAMVNTGEF